MDEEASLDQYINMLASGASAKGYNYWISHSDDITFEEVYDGRETQVEIDILEITDTYVHLLIIASNSPLGWYVRKSTSVIIQNEQCKPLECDAPAEP